MTELSCPHYYCNDGGEVRLAKYNRWYEFYEPTLEPLCLVLHFWERECLEFWTSQNIYFEIEVSFSKMFVCVDECLLMPFTDLLDFYYFSCIFFNRYYFWILGVCSFLKYPCVTLVFTIGVFHFNYRKKVQGKAPIYALEEEEEESPSTYNN